MTRTTFGIVCGIVYGLRSAGTTISLEIIGPVSARYGTAGS